MADNQQEQTHHCCLSEQEKEQILKFYDFIQFTNQNKPNTPDVLEATGVDFRNRSDFTPKFDTNDGKLIVTYSLFSDLNYESRSSKIKIGIAKWNSVKNLKLVQSNDYDENANIRISFTPGGSYSSVGSAFLKIKGRTNMNFGWIDSVSNDNDGTIAHEFGHALGLFHEHQNPSADWLDPSKKEEMIQYYMRTQGWTRNTVIFNLLEEEVTPYHTTWDQTSIMGYAIPVQFCKPGINISTRRINTSNIDIQFLSSFIEKIKTFNHQKKRLTNIMERNQQEQAHHCCLSERDKEQILKFYDFIQFTNQNKPNSPDVLKATGVDFRNRSGFTAKFDANDGKLIVTYSLFSDLHYESRSSKIKAGIAKWNSVKNLKLVQSNNYDENANIRISFRRDGSYSSVGSAFLKIKDRTNMNFGWIDTIDNDNDGTIAHEFGHALGLFHEHQNPNADWLDPSKKEEMIQYYMDDQGWNRDTVIFNLLEEEITPYHTSWDQTSIMGYAIPKRFCKPGVDISTRRTNTSNIDISFLIDFIEKIKTFNH